RGGVAMSAAKARALTMGPKQIWSEYSAASKQPPNGVRNSWEREAWPNNSLQQAPGGRSATPRRSSAQGRMRANARSPDVKSPARRREWTSWRTYYDWSGTAPKGAKGPGSAARFAYLQHRNHETQSRPADL